MWGGSLIQGENVYLRPIVKEDIGYLNSWKNDEETFKYLGGGFMPISIDQQIKWVDKLSDTYGDNKRFIICDKKDKPVGLVGLYSINWIHRTAEIGIYIGDKKSKGKGYGKEASKLIENFAAEYLNLRKLKLFVVTENTPALNMWKSLGYKTIGEFKKERYIKGEYKNLTIMEKFIQNN